MAVYFAAATPIERFTTKLERDRNKKPTAVSSLSFASIPTNTSQNQQGSFNLMPLNNTSVGSVQTQDVFSGNLGGGRNPILNQIGQIGQIADQRMSIQVDRFNAKQQVENARRAAMNRAGQAQAGGTANPFFGGGGNGFTGAIGSLKGLGLNSEQMRNATSIINIGRQRGLSTGDITIGLMTALAESGLRNVNYGDRDSLGLFQQRPSQGWGSRAQVSDVTYSTNKFFDTLAKTRRGATPWLSAQYVQRSAFADGSNYKAQYALAKRIVTAANTPGGSKTKTAAAGWINQNEWRYHDYDGWYGAQCVDLFNFYNRGFVGGNFIGGVTGAKDIWGNAAMNKNYVALSGRNRAQMGDVVVFGSSWGGGYGHVGIVVEDRGGSLRVLNANATAQGSRGPTVISTLSKNGMLGYYRPKRLM